MKKIFTLIILLIVCVCRLSAQNELHSISFTVADGRVFIDSKSMTKLQLPVELIFRGKADFNGKEIRLLDERNISIEPAIQVFGNGAFSPDPDNDYFKIFIDADGIIHPGGGTINTTRIKIEVDNEPFQILLEGKLINKYSLSRTSNETYSPGYVYYDAIKIHDENTDNFTRATILNAYGIADTKSNPFLSEQGVIPEGHEKSVNELLAQHRATGSLLTQLGNMDVTYFAAGIARFLAERTKEELNSTFFEKMKQQLKLYPELNRLFPKTVEFLDNIQNFSYASIIQVLKEAFETDIQNLPVNMYELTKMTSSDCTSADEDDQLKCKIRMDKMHDFFTKDIRGMWCGIALFSVKTAYSSSNPAEMLKSIAISTDLEDLKKFAYKYSLYPDYNFAEIINLANFLSQSLLSKEENQVWISSKELIEMVKDEKLFKAYLGLLYALPASEEISFSDPDGKPKSFREVLNDINTNWNTYWTPSQNLFMNLNDGFNAVNNSVRKISLAVNNSTTVDPQTLYCYYHSVQSSVDALVKNEMIKKFCQTDIAGKYNEVIKWLNPSVDLIYHISAKQYSASLYDAIGLLNNLDHSDNRMIKAFTKYGTVISSVAQAQSSDEVKQAIEASALPAGSSSIKKNTSWSISLNAYVGAYYGKAWNSVKQVDTVNQKKDTVTVTEKFKSAGLYAPIGFSFNKGFKKPQIKGVPVNWGLSVGVQIIDLGALVNFYMLNGDTALLPSDFKVRLSNIFAPGLQLALNIPRVPLSIVGGCQWIPALNQVEQISGTSEIKAESAWRWQISVVVDIPMFNLKSWDFKDKVPKEKSKKREKQ